MSDDPDPERLRDLQARLDRLKGVPGAEKTRAGEAFSGGEVGWRMVTELLSGMLIGLAIGYGLDWLFGTMPVFLVIFCLFGFAAGVKTMLGTAQEVQKKTTGGGSTHEKGN